MTSISYLLRKVQTTVVSVLYQQCLCTLYHVLMQNMCYCLSHNLWHDFNCVNCQVYFTILQICKGSYEQLYWIPEVFLLHIPGVSVLSVNMKVLLSADTTSSSIPAFRVRNILYMDTRPLGWAGFSQWISAVVALSTTITGVDTPAKIHWLFKANIDVLVSC